MAEREKIVFYTPQGALAFHGTYDAAVRRLFELENQRRPQGNRDQGQISGAHQKQEGRDGGPADRRPGRPQERYTVRGPGGKPFPRRGIELVLGRLYEYEREENKKE